MKTYGEMQDLVKAISEKQTLMNDLRYELSVTKDKMKKIESALWHEIYFESSDLKNEGQRNAYFQQALEGSEEYKELKEESMKLTKEIAEADTSVEENRNMFSLNKLFIRKEIKDNEI